MRAGILRRRSCSWCPVWYGNYSLEEWSATRKLDHVSNQPFIQDFGNRVRALRIERGLTQERLAALAGMHFSAIGHIERASRSSTLDTILKLARALGIQPRELLPEIELKSTKRR